MRGAPSRRIYELAPAALAQREGAAAFVRPTQPTVVLVRDGVVVGQSVGPVSSQELRAIIGRATAVNE